MGNNAAYTHFEQTVIALYDQGVLTLPILDAIAEPYRGTDIDSGGSQDLLTKDGKDLIQICVELVRPGYVPDPDPDFPQYGPDWYEPWAEIRSARWGWW